jgi:hypothetical protein
MEVRRMLDRLRGLLRLLFVWRISDIKQDESELNPADCILMQAFGQQVEFIGLISGLYTSRIAPGPANEAIADVMIMADRGRLPPVLAQWEFAVTHAARRGELRVEKVLGSRGGYCNTREILQEAKNYMDQRGWKRAVIVAHPWHLVRCIWVAEKLGIETVHDQFLVQDLNDQANVWNNRVNVPENQMQTKSLPNWLWYELRARGYFWLKGWI